MFKLSSIRPLSLMRLTQINDPDELLKNHNRENIIVEHKLDGWKSQIIKNKGKIGIYSRRGQDVTEKFPMIRDALNIPDDTFVEGEIVYWEKSKQDEGKVTSVAGSSVENAKKKLKELPGKFRLHLYDILWYKGKNVSKEPLEKRRKILESAVKVNDTVKITKQYPFSQWQKAMNTAVKEGGEGIVLKLKDKPYEWKPAGQAEPKPKNIMYKYKGIKETTGKTDSDDYVVYDYSITDKGKLKAKFGQYYKGKLYHISEISNFSKENEDKVKQKLKKGPFVIEIGFQEIVGKGLRHQKLLRFREDKSPKDATMNEEHVKNINNFDLAKKAFNTSRIITAKEKHTSAMLAIMIPQNIVKKLKDITSKDLMDDLHTTLVYLGKKKDLNKTTLEAIKKATERVCSKHQPLDMRISGAGMFTKGEDGFPTYIVPNAKGLSALQADLENTIGSIIDLPSEHGWVPHITIGYFDEKPELPDLVKYPNWKVDKVRLQVGEEKMADIPIGIQLSKRAQMDHLSISYDPATWRDEQLREVLTTPHLQEELKKDAERLRMFVEQVKKRILPSKQKGLEVSNLPEKEWWFLAVGPDVMGLYPNEAVANQARRRLVDEVNDALLGNEEVYLRNWHIVDKVDLHIGQGIIETYGNPKKGLDRFYNYTLFDKIKKQYAEDVVNVIKAPKDYDRKRAQKPVQGVLPDEDYRIIEYPTEVGDKAKEQFTNANKKLIDVGKSIGKQIVREKELKEKGLDPTKASFRISKRAQMEEGDTEKAKEVLIDKNGVKLTRGQIATHYKKNKDKIMNRIKGKPVLLYLGIGKNKNILKRNHNEKQIVITNADPDKSDDPNNYFYWVKRRLLSIHEVFGPKTDIGFVDLDIHGNFPLSKAKAYAKELVKQLKSKMGVSPTIYQSGGTSLHVEFKLKEKKDIDTLRKELKKLLDEINEKYDNVTTGLVKGNGMRSDISTLHNKGSLRVPGVLGETYGKEKKAISKVALSIRDIVKEAKKKEYIWLWGDEKLITAPYGEKDHYHLALEKGIDPNKIKYRGFVEIKDDGNEIDTYGQSFLEMPEEVQRRVETYFGLEPFNYDIKVIELPRGFRLEAKGLLSKYKKKRKFDKTPEPEGEVKKGNKHRFVIQRHLAEKAGEHFDIRLENDGGTLSSWAVPKHHLPSKGKKLLAKKTEDHPVKYLSFKGKIPEGQYGAGKMEIHDSGTYEEIERSSSKIIFKLNGKKEKDSYTLVKTKGDNWLLMRHKEQINS